MERKKRSIKQKLATLSGLALLLFNLGCDQNKNDVKVPAAQAFPQELTNIVETLGNNPYNYVILYKTEGNKKKEVHVAFPEALTVKNESIDKLTGGNGLIQVQIGSEPSCYINLGFIREVLNDCEEEQGYVANGWEFIDFLKEKLNTGFYLQAAKDKRIKVPIKYKSTIEDDFDRFMIEDEKEGKYFRLYFKDKKGNERHMGFTPLFLKDRESKPYEMIDAALNAMKKVYGENANVTTEQIFAVYKQLEKYARPKVNADTPYISGRALERLDSNEYLTKLKKVLGIDK